MKFSKGGKRADFPYNPWIPSGVKLCMACLIIYRQIKAILKAYSVILGGGNEQTLHCLSSQIDSRGQMEAYRLTERVQKFVSNNFTNEFSIPTGVSRFQQHQGDPSIHLEQHKTGVNWQKDSQSYFTSRAYLVGIEQEGSCPSGSVSRLSPAFAFTY